METIFELPRGIIPAQNQSLLYDSEGAHAERTASRSRLLLLLLVRIRTFRLELN